MKGAAAKQLGKMMAGQNLGKFFDTFSSNIGKIAGQGTAAAVKAGTDAFMPGIAQKELPAILRSSATSLLPQTATAASQLGVAALGAYGLDRAFDQQSVHSQPMSGGTGDRSLDNFIMSQQLQNQKFIHDMALVQARGQARTPGYQPQGQGGLGAMGFEKSLLDDVRDFSRMTLGTGFRA